MASHLLAPRHISSSTLSRPAGAGETAVNRVHHCGEAYADSRDAVAQQHPLQMSRED